MIWTLIRNQTAFVLCMTSNPIVSGSKACSDRESKSLRNSRRHLGTLANQWQGQDSAIPADRRCAATLSWKEKSFEQPEQAMA